MAKPRAKGDKTFAGGLIKTSVWRAAKAICARRGIELAQYLEEALVEANKNG